MEITPQIKAGLGVAFNEATLLGIELRPEDRTAAITLALLSLPEVGPSPKDSRVQVRLSPVGRLAASLRLGSWNDPDAKVVPFSIEELLTTARSFGGLPIYGWDFVDAVDKEPVNWFDRLSLDWSAGTNGMKHTLTLFQEGPDRHLDVCIWFDALQLFSPAGVELDINDVIASGQRWWDALYAKDPRVMGQGIYPLEGRDV
jgi:hypothetical protein